MKGTQVHGTSDLDVCVARADEKSVHRIFLLYTSESKEQDCFMQKKILQSLACLDLVYIFKAVLRILMVKFVLV